ncbi:endonuclease/exonuclease/phosphatase family protein [Nocardioides terrae]|uniref:endonuclease/exonuclease/phosphatase family protein n=1 Tax=Nocardioides terrae TaxID=574651 RepID=UPI001587AB5D|nr:endonuclease/exonuclease/phosphatase family protein [Nocardioides terrae]
MLRPTRSVLLDAAVLIAIVGVVAGLVVLQVTAGGRGDDRATPSSQQSGGPVEHATLGPSPTPSTPAAAPTTTLPATPSTTAPVPPQPGSQASSLAQSAQSVAASPSIFRIATFNVLGASHTRKGGDSFIKTPYDTRMSDAVRILANHAVDVVGFQEFEPPQAQAFQRQMGAGWGMFPRPGSDQADGRQTIAWRESAMELLSARTVTYPYFGGQTIHTPAVQLRMRATEDTFWVISVHNPATNCAVCGGNNDRYRSAAVQREVEAIRALSADGTPVFLVGDMNSKRTFFCEMAAALPVVFAAGGSYGAGGCRPPQPTPIDWILATAGVSFSGYLSDDGPLVDAATDHPVNSVTAMLP